MFADDVASANDTVVRLQRQINLVSDFCDYTGIKKHFEQSKVMVFRNGGALTSNERWYYRGTKLEIVPFYK